MAKLVSVIASTHNPRIFWNRDQADKADLEVLYGTFADVRKMLAETKPDMIVAVGNDHLDNFFLDNMPTFSVGIAPTAEASLASFSGWSPRNSARTISQVSFFSFSNSATYTSVLI